MTIIIHHPRQNTWYSKLQHEIFEVEESGDPTEWKIIDDPLYRHIMKSDCEEIILILGERLTA